jgi:hypothetical protein
VSTFLVSLGVVAATIAAVLYVALSGPDQPATIRRQPSRARKPRRRPVPAPVAHPDAAGPPAAQPPVAPQLPAAASAPASPSPSAAAARAPAQQAGITSGPTLALPDSDPMRLRVLPAAPTTLWVRIRSGVALVVLVAVLGALLALVVGGILVGVAFLIRSATG